MNSASRSVDAARIFAGLVLLLTLLIAAPAFGQVWTPYARTGSIRLAYTYYDGGDHLFNDDSIDGQTSLGYVARGSRWFLGDTYSHGLSLSAEYGLTDRLSVDGVMGWTRAGYFGRSPVNLNIDDGRYRSYLTDVQVGARYRVVDHPVVVTPSLVLTLPTNDYPSYGHAAPGRGLAEFRAGVAAGWPFNVCGRPAVLGAGVSLGLAEKYDGRRTRRWSTDANFTTFPGGRWSLGVGFSNLVTAGGVNWSGNVEGDDPHSSGGSNLDQLPLSNARYMRVGGFVGYELSSALGLGAQYQTTVSGRNTEDADVVTLSINLGFDLSPEIDLLSGQE